VALVDLNLPRLGASMLDGTVTRWHKQIGERVDPGDVVCEIETEKVNAEIEATTTGTLTEILAAPGTTIDVGVAIARIEED
jgi:2-oxoisovalerate dehydrogenase E2 component (dihydrolipoyl transacylase)